MPFIDAGDPDREWKIGVAEGGPDGLWGVTAGPRGSSWDSTAMAATISIRRTQSPEGFEVRVTSDFRQQERADRWPPHSADPTSPNSESYVY